MKQDNYSYCQVIGLTDRGLKRAANEDWLGEKKTPNGWVAVVCDGMGGHVGGATASHIAVDTILDFLSSEYFEDPRVAIGKAIDQANAAVREKAAQQPELNGMGSTCVLLIIRDGKVYMGHVGDSRIYLIRNHRIHQLTKDHSYVQMLVDMGEISQEQAEHHPRKNEITNALGIPQMQPATVMQNPIEPQAGDCFLLCSDGLSGMVETQTIEHVISQQKQLSAQERAAKLIEKAKEGGGLDNITVQLVEFGATPAAVNECKSDKKKWLWPLLVLALAAISVLVYFLIPRDNQDVQQEEQVAEEGKEVKHIAFNRPLTANNDTILLLVINGTSDTASVVLMDANNGYLETLENVLWRNPVYQQNKILINYDGMPVNGKNAGVVRLISPEERGFNIKFEAADCSYVIEVDIDHPQPTRQEDAHPRSQRRHTVPGGETKEQPAYEQEHPAEKGSQDEKDATNGSTAEQSETPADPPKEGPVERSEEASSEEQETPAENLSN